MAEARTETALSDLDFLLTGKSEDLGIEYKSWVDTSVGETRAKLARHIAALANHGGGAGDRGEGWRAGGGGGDGRARDG